DVVHAGAVESTLAEQTERGPQDEVPAGARRRPGGPGQRRLDLRGPGRREQHGDASLAEQLLHSRPWEQSATERNGADGTVECLLAYGDPRSIEIGPCHQHGLGPELEHVSFMAGQLTAALRVQPMALAEVGGEVSWAIEHQRQDVGDHAPERLFGV